MYCSTCGVAVAESLSYCNHCGARIVASNRDEIDTSREVRPGLLVSAMAGTFILGMFAITALLGVMKAVLGLQGGQILGFAALSFFIMISLESVYLYLLFRRKRLAEEQVTTGSLAQHTTKELSAPHARELQSPLSSVTDHTTRAFDPIYVNRNKTP